MLQEKCKRAHPFAEIQGCVPHQVTHAVTFLAPVTTRDLWNMAYS